MDRVEETSDAAPAAPINAADTSFLRRHAVWISLSLALSALLAVAAGWLLHRENREETLYIALSGPMSGNYASNGQAMRRAVELRLAEVNRNGGIDGKQVELLVFDDQNDAELARRNALEIATATPALGVVGHYTSSTSLAASPVYLKHGIPAISGTATTDELTRENSWYFRTTFNNADQAAIIANYIRKVGGLDSAYVLSVDNAFGKTLRESFLKTAREIGLTIAGHWHFTSDNPSSFDEQREAMLSALQAGKGRSALFLATHSAEAAAILANLRRLNKDIMIIGPDSLSSSSFQEQMQAYPQERARPGYYTDGVYTTTPFIQDLGGSQRSEDFRFAYARAYGEEPPVNATMYYDAAAALLHALRGVDSEYQLSMQREQVRDGLWQLASLASAVEGVSGMIYFDEHGDAVKPVPMGVFSNGRLIPALEQFQLLGSVTHLDNLLEEALGDRVIYVNGKFLSRAKVVYAGVEFNEISDLDMENYSYTADFYLWFRFQYGFDDKNIEYDFSDRNIEFVNLYTQVGERGPVFEPVIEQISRGKYNMMTRTYHLKTKFKADFDFSDYPLDRRTLPLRFQHKHFTRNQLIYVVDTLGMDPGPSGRNLLRKFQRNNVFPVGGWKVNQIEFFQTSKKTDSTLGVPELFGSEQRIESSVFNVEVEIERNINSFILKNMLPVIFIICVGYFMFYIPIAGPGFAVRITLGVNVIVTTSLFHLKMASSMPAIDYLVLMEYLFYTVYVLAIISMLLSIFKQVKSTGDSPEDKKWTIRIDVVGRIFYPLAIVLILGGVIYFYT